MYGCSLPYNHRELEAWQAGGVHARSETAFVVQVIPNYDPAYAVSVASTSLDQYVAPMGSKASLKS